jgi:N-terminal domain of anti-restriction factor ArdC/IrrE N-terminal-like domain
MSSPDPRDDLLAVLTDGISRLTDSNQWLRYLDFQSRFHHYSFGNVMLIAAQRPEASRVAGFHAWKKLGRTIRKGEKAVWILAPIMTRRARDGDLDDDRVVHGFKYVPVFDVSQTEGEGLPTVCHKLSGECPANSLAALTRVALGLGYSVEDAELSDGANGDCTFGVRRIRVEARNSSAQRVKTLAHEIAHALLHVDEQNRVLAELEAESVAYLVCQRLGMDTARYSFGYVAIWAGGGVEAISAIKASCTNIQRTAHLMLGRLGSDGAGISSEAA